jgi:hypothetical protein
VIIEAFLNEGAGKTAGGWILGSPNPRPLYDMPWCMAVGMLIKSTSSKKTCRGDSLNKTKMISILRNWASVIPSQKADILWSCLYKNKEEMSETRLPL